MLHQGRSALLRRCRGRQLARCLRGETAACDPRRRGAQRAGSTVTQAVCHGLPAAATATAGQVSDVTELLAGLHSESWQQALAEEFAKPYFADIARFVAAERAAHKVFPQKELVFRALNLTPLEDVRAVVIGQDPYHGPGQADGLSFSVPQGVPLPPSLKNVFKELEADVPGFSAPLDGSLTKWAREGVLLLNATLTVRRGQANSHSKCGWQTFTDAIIRAVSARKENVVFLLWGNFARKKGALVDRSCPVCWLCGFARPQRPTRARGPGITPSRRCTPVP
uniref:Uracil-DNA glycosylase n=2 Tax=Alexandrium monilatum TaxID=311494 RepID=A0A7S4V8Y3_9DINO